MESVLYPLGISCASVLAALTFLWGIGAIVRRKIKLEPNQPWVTLEGRPVMFVLLTLLNFVFGSVCSLAAWAMVSRAILNLDETITKE